MKHLYYTTLISILLSSNLFLAAHSSAEKYDKLLARLEVEKVIRTQGMASPAPTKWTLTFEHERLPVLDGVWILKKKATKRKELLLQKPYTRIHCNSRLPSYENAIEKEVILSPQGPDLFVFKAIYPVTKEQYLDSAKTQNNEYQNYGFKGVLIPEEITYTYTLKLTDYIQHRGFPRQLWFQGRLFLENITSNKITGKGYENIYTPECHGYVTDLIEFELVRKDYCELAYGTVAKT